MKKRIYKVIILTITAILILISYYFLNNKYGFAIPCIIHKLTGFYCPGCGITRCLFSLIKGHIYEAFMYNQLVFILLPFILIYVIYETYLYITNQKDDIMIKIPNYWFIILLVITIGYGILRNLEIFSYLRPY